MSAPDERAMSALAGEAWLAGYHAGEESERRAAPLWTGFFVLVAMASLVGNMWLGLRCLQTQEALKACQEQAR